MLRQPGASGQTEGPAPCSTDGDLDARSDALSVRDQGTLSPDALSVRDQGTLSPNQLSMVALRIEKSYSIVSYTPARTKVSITGREGPVLQRFSQRSLLQGGGPFYRGFHKGHYYREGGAVLQRFSQRSLLITGMGGPVSRRFPRPARLCVVLGAIVRVLVGGGPLCVVLGATLLVLVEGGAFCVVLGATLLVVLWGRCVLHRTGRCFVGFALGEVHAFCVVVCGFGPGDKECRWLRHDTPMPAAAWH